MCAHLWGGDGNKEVPFLQVGIGKGVLLVGHSGGQEKTRTYMILLPAKKMAVVVMTNSEHAKIGKVTGRLLSLLWPPEPTR